MQSFRRIKIFKNIIAFDNYIECLPVGHPGPLDLPDLPSLPSQAIAVAVAVAVITIEKEINLITIMNMNMEIHEIPFLFIF
uniref:Uncharacterized protein n=1 Tax=viral metagenome TaxID=1070528 RepID=A0A6C0JM29_9ZZZZ